jgi:hypothetical protein
LTVEGIDAIRYRRCSAADITAKETKAVGIIIASGYENTYGGEYAEIGYAEQKKWYPTTTDFRATGRGSGATGEATTFAEVLDLIAAEKPGSIQNLGLVGHANIRTFSMAGRVTIKPSDVVFTEAGMINPISIKDNLAKITGLQDRFAKDAQITLYACHAGTGKELLDALSNAFGVCAYGFTNEIAWCLNWKGRKIISRGRTYYDSLGTEIYPACDSPGFSADIRRWSPDSKSCAKPATPNERR